MEIHNMTSGAYCRLCAHYDEVNTLIDLNVDKEKYEEITSALSLLNATYVDLSKNNGLHLTICADCYYCLGKTHEFLSKVKNAQHTLASLSLSKEVLLSDDKIFTTKEESSDEFCYDPIEISLNSIKTETDDCHFSELEVEFNLEHSPCDVKNLFESTDGNSIGNSIIKEENVDKTHELTSKANEVNSKNELKCDTLPYLLGSEPPPLIDLALPKKLSSRGAYKTISKCCHPLNKTSNELSKIITITSKSMGLPALSKIKPNIKTSKVLKKYNPLSKTIPTNLGNLLDEAYDQNTNLNKNIHETFNQNTNISKNTDKPSNENTNKFDTNDSDGSDNFEDIPDFEFDITNITKTFICKICDEKFDSRNKRYWHKVKAHNFKYSKMGKNGTPLTVEDLTCEYCKRVFSRMSYLYNHILSKHKQKPEIYICEYCGIECHGRAKLQDHMKKHSGITHICRICNKTFKHRNELVNHVRRHMNVRQFECHHCGRRCVTKRDMKNHLKVHSDLKRFQCNVCNKAFKHKAHWKRHMTMHAAGDSVTQRMPFECNSCGRKFSCWGNCDKHMKRKHNTTLKKGNKDIAKTTEEETSNIDLEEWKKDVLVDLRRGQRTDAVRRGL